MYFFTVPWTTWKVREPRPGEQDGHQSVRSPSWYLRCNPNRCIFPSFEPIFIVPAHRTRYTRDLIDNPVRSFWETGSPPCYRQLDGCLFFVHELAELVNDELRTAQRTVVIVDYIHLGHSVLTTADRTLATLECSEPHFSLLKQYYDCDLHNPLLNLLSHCSSSAQFISTEDFYNFFLYFFAVLCG